MRRRMNDAVVCCNAIRRVIAVTEEGRAVVHYLGLEVEPACGWFCVGHFVQRHWLGFWPWWEFVPNQK